MCIKLRYRWESKWRGECKSSKRRSNKKKGDFRMTQKYGKVGNIGLLSIYISKNLFPGTVTFAFPLRHFLLHLNYWYINLIHREGMHSSLLALIYHLEWVSVSELEDFCHRDGKAIFPLLKNRWLKQTIYLIWGQQAARI